MSDAPSDGAKWRRLCYRNPSWKLGYCGYNDGFAREHWTQPSAGEMKRRVDLDEARGLEAFWEEIK